MESRTNQMKFIDINDHCLWKIFEYLPASDLCSTSLTCKRLQSLAHAYFGREYPNEWISIDINLNARAITEWSFSNDDENKVLKYFGKCIRNVRMRSPMNSRGWIDLGLLYNFLNNECCVELKSLELNLGSDIELNSIAECEIKKQLNTVESVKIIDVACVQSTYEGLLEYCVNLRSLVLATPAENVYDWLQFVYPQLETLTLPWYNGHMPASIHDFLQHHQQLKDITCEGVHLRNPKFQNFENIQCLKFRAVSVGELEDIVRQLKNNNANKSIKSFGIKLGICDGRIGPVIDVLNSIQPINKLEFDANEREFRLPPFERLEELKVNLESGDHSILDTIPEDASDLKRLDLSFSLRYPMGASMIKRILIPIVKNLWQLEQFSFAFTNFAAHEMISQADLNELESIRLAVHRPRYVRAASNIDFHLYFGYKSDDLPPRLVSSGNTLTVTHHFQHQLYKSDYFFEYSVAEVIFE